MSYSITEIDLADLNPEDITLDQLTNDWEIHQLKKGHRFSADDIFTAYVASKHHHNPKMILDLGSGIGTVGLLTLSRFPNAHLTMIEAQQISHQLAQKTIAHNEINQRVRALRGDIRNPNLCVETFDLITGSPPYFPTNKGIISPHPQRAACRMELRGSIIDYAKAASLRLKDDGVFVVCFAAGDPRGLQSIQESGLHCSLRQDVIFRSDLPPTISIFVAQKRSCTFEHAPPITIRDAQGKWTKSYMAVRNFEPLPQT